MASARLRIVPATSTGDLADVRTLFRTYVAWLGLDLAFQGFEEELASLPGKYAPPHGALLIARAEDDAPIGCIAMRPFDPPEVCELKRLYVAPAARGRHLGRALVDHVVAAAEHAGYRRMLLDTLPDMAVARAVYLAAGFTPVAPYYDTPLPGTLFMAKDLSRGTSR